MLVTSKQLSLGRSHSWDTLGGNEGQWDRGEAVYEQQARIAGRRNSLSYGERGGWHEPPPGACPPDLDLKREPYSYQDSLYGHDPRGVRKGSVSELSHNERPNMAHRGSIQPQEYYPHDPAVTPRPPEGFYRAEHQPPPPHPHPLSRSGSHFGMSQVGHAAWDQGQGGRAGPAAPSSSSPLPPPPPPNAHDLNRAYREPAAVAAAAAAAKMMPDGLQRVPSPHYGLEHSSPRYASEPPPLTGQPVYTDVNGRPLDPQQQAAATCLVLDPASQGIMMRQETASPYTIQQQQQLQQQQQFQQQQQLQQQQQQQIQQQQLQQQQLQQQQLQQQQVQQQQLQQQQIQQQLQQQQQQPLPAPPAMTAYDPNPPMAAPLPPPPAPAPTHAPPTVPVQAPAPAPLPSASPLPPPPHMAPQTPAPSDPKRTADPEFLALLRNEGLSESTISSLIQQGFDSTSMLAVMEENDVRTVATNLGQARVLSRVAVNCKRPAEALPAPSQPQTPMRTRSNSFSHRSEVYHQQPQQHHPHPPHAMAMDPQLMTPQMPGAMHTISPRMGEVMGRRPSSAPSQHFLEAAGGYPGPAPRTLGPYGGAMVPVQSRPMSAYSQHPGGPMPGMPMQGMQMMPHQMAGSMPAMPGSIHPMPGMPQQMPVSMPALPPPPQQVPKAYSTNYTVPMELMKRDRNLPPLSPMHSPHPSSQLMRKAGGPSSDNALVPVGASMQGQSALAANQMLSRRTGPPVIVSTMASPDTSKLLICPYFPPSLCLPCLFSVSFFWLFYLIV